MRSTQFPVDPLHNRMLLRYMGISLVTFLQMTSYRYKLQVTNDGSTQPFIPGQDL